jgi:hypothetical protein
MLELHVAAPQEREQVVPARRRRLLPEPLPALAARADGELPRAHDERAFLDRFDLPVGNPDEVPLLAHLDHERLVHAPAPAHDRRV